MITSKETVRIILNSGEVLVDYRDLHWFGKYKFYVVQGRGQSKYVIANDKPRNRTVQLHQLIMNAPTGMEVDHVNRNGLDNTRGNLRIVSHQKNQCNQSKRRGTSSKYRGVSFSKARELWCAYLTTNGKAKNLGRFTTESAAAIAFNNYVIKNGLDRQLNVVD